METHESSFNSHHDYYPSPMEAQQGDSNEDSQSQSYESHQNGSSNGQQAYSRIKYQYHPPHPQVLNYVPQPQLQPPQQQRYSNPPQNYQNNQQQYTNYNKRPSNDDEDDFETNNQPVLMGRRRMTSGEKKNSRGKRSEQYENILQQLKSKRRLKRKFRHKDRPKKAKSAYNLFVEDVVPRIKSQNPTFGAPDLVRVAAQMYNQLNQQQKRPYQERYLIDKKRFDRQRQVFFQNHPQMDYRFDAKKNKQPYTPSKSQSSYGGQKSMKQGNGYYDNQYGRGGYVDSD